jgi:hypothetical protein
MPITGQGWELLVKRLGLQTRGGVTRTYATYQVFRDGVASADLSGHLCECKGPGDNEHPGSGKRIKAGKYPLSTQFGTKYKTSGFGTGASGDASKPMPGLLLERTGARSAILIHPGHLPKLYLSSIGCLNPTKPLRAASNMNFVESRARVIALIDDLKAFSPQSFNKAQNTRIPKALVVIEGEPTAAISDQEALEPAVA